MVGLKGLPVLLLVIAAIGCYCCTLAPIMWVVLSEIFPNRIRGAAMSVSVFALWLTCFALAQLLPVGRDLLGPGPTLLIFAGICAFGFFYILVQLPETKGKSLEEIERSLLG